MDFNNDLLPVGILVDKSEPDMTLLDAMKSRRSVRLYQDKIVPVEQVRELIHQAANAPSACNKQGWKFIVIQDKKSLDRLYKKGSAAFVNKANQALLVCYQNTSDNNAWADEIQSASAIISYFQLIAHTRGIGSCWICHMPSKNEIRKFFKIPFTYQPVALVTYGYYKPELKVVQRKIKTESLICLEKWNFSDVQKVSLVKVFIKRFIRKLYYMIPKRELIRKVTFKYEKKFENEKYK